MLEGWQHADVISALALGVSGLAFLVSLVAARYTAIQTRLAQRKAREEEADKEPAIESELSGSVWPGWYRLRLNIRNRLDVSIVCEHLRLREPQVARAMLADVQPLFGSYLIPDQPPEQEAMHQAIDLDIAIPAAGSLGYAGMRRPRLEDRRYVEFLVFIDPSRSFTPRQTLEASLKVRRSNDREAFAECLIVTKIPARTNGDN